MVESSFRKIRTFELDPVYMSLGVQPATFKDDGPISSSKGFSAALNGPGDILWLFSGSDYFTYNLRSKRMERGPDPIASNWAMAGTTAMGLPQDFKSGIDAAVWAGEDFPNFIYFFKGDRYVRLNASRVFPLALTGLLKPQQFERSIVVDEGPANIAGVWARVKGISMLTRSPSAAVHGVRQHRAKIHFFDRFTYMRHSLLNGNLEAGPEPLSVDLPLPHDNFPGPVDLAFYGSGSEKDHLFVCSGLHCARIDVQNNLLLKIEMIEKVFPAFAIHLPRPQIFLVEDYVLETFVGDPRRGELADTIITPPHSEKTVVLVTEIITSAATRVSQNLLQSVDATTTSDFLSKVDSRQDTGDVTDSYRQRLQAVLHADASVNPGIWGGEVNAQLNEQGATDQQRKSFAESAFAAVSNQIKSSTQVVSMKALSQQSAQTFTGRIFHSETQSFKNESAVGSETVLFAVIEPYVGLLTLKNVRGAVTDGIQAPEIMSLVDLQRRLPTILKDGSDTAVKKLVDYIRNELANISNATGGTSSILEDGASGGLRINNQIKFPYTIDFSPGQTIDTRGIVIAGHEVLQPTYKMSTFA